MSEWSNMTFNDIAEFNPRESIKKGEVTVKIGMDKLQPFCRDIAEVGYEEFSGGTKFRNNDTIMARITPCLENGKTAMVSVLADGQVGFGSTEYIVFRAKNGISDPHFLYYLVCSPAVREPAIKSMVGSSGRQRVQTDVVQNLEFLIPALDEQKKIGEFLKKLDDKIAVNNKINRNLEDQLKAIFIELFGAEIDAIKTGTGTPLGELIDVIDNRGKTPPLTTETFDFPIIDVGALRGNVRVVDFNNCTKFVDEDTYNNWFRSGHPKPWDILLSTVGSLAEMKIFLGEKGCIAQNVVALRSKAIAPLFLYQYLNYIRNDLVAYNIGSVQPSIKVTHIIKHPILVPDDNRLATFEDTAKVISDQVYKLYCESEVLKGIRNSLLPKLMSGELDVSDLEI